MEKNTKNTQKKDRKVGQILGINITGTSTREVLARVEGLITDNVKFYIVTPNPEIILMAQRNEKLKNAMNGTELAIPDGIGLKFAIPDLPIIKGRELFSELIKLSNKKMWKVFLLGGLDDEAKLASRQLTINNQQLTICSDKGPRLNNNAEPATEVDRKLQFDTITKINKFKPQLLFVAFGNPKQEIWVHENYSKLNIGGAMAVGGAFRYIAGLSALPPKWMASAGLEWLWRLIVEPSRIGRIFNAVVVFPLRVLIYKTKHPV
ncbi:MAG: WecB/TagA/CpsF family glycosyltransferase [Candidatus Woesebacteria bacterium]|nr:WecB/TagA/CpsF family glycosyltransferase [Candidatus Woesebacteria bacterium]